MNILEKIFDSKYNHLMFFYITYDKNNFMSKNLNLLYIHLRIDLYVEFDDIRTVLKLNS